MIGKMKENRLNEALAAAGLATFIELIKAMRHSKILSAMVIIRGLFFAGFIFFLVKMAGA